MEHSWSPAGATGGKSDDPENRSNKPIGNRWQPTATVPERMVRRGSTVRVRQRALQKSLHVWQLLVCVQSVHGPLRAWMEPFMELSRREHALMRPDVPRARGGGIAPVAL